MIRQGFFFALMGLFLTLSRVDAGNPWFEPLTRFSSSDISTQPFGTIAANVTNQDPFSRGVGTASEKRWVTVERIVKERSTLWPDKTIKYCFKDTQTRDRFNDLIIKGMDLWYQAGLDSSFKMTEVSRNDCTNKRSEVLLINQGNGLSTSVGVAEASSMTLSDSDEVGMLNVLSNVAHEIGHAWGLYHEHQNTYFWDAPYSTGGSGRWFGASNFHCENLKDYEDVMEKVQKLIDEAENEYVQINIEYRKSKICQDQGIAKGYGFSASEWLPIRDGTAKVGTEDYTKIDWDSIMLYPSGAGGKDLGNGERENILTRPNGDEIGLNLVPSTRDVAGLTQMYGSNDKVDKPLLNDKKSGWRDQFNRIRNKDTGSCN